MNCKISLALLFSFGLFGSKISAQACIGTGILNIIVQDCTGTSSPADARVEVFPNPAQESFWVKNGGDFLSLKVFDLFGTKILEQNVAANSTIEIKTENLPDGLYLVRWHSESNRGAKFIAVAAN